MKIENILHIRGLCLSRKEHVFCQEIGYEWVNGKNIYQSFTFGDTIKNEYDDNG